MVEQPGSNPTTTPKEKTMGRLGLSASQRASIAASVDMRAVEAFQRAGQKALASTSEAQWASMKKAIDAYARIDMAAVQKTLAAAVRADFASLQEAAAKSQAAILRESVAQRYEPSAIPAVLFPRSRTAALEQRVADLEQSHAAAEAENQELRQRIVQIDHRTERIAGFFDPDPSVDDDGQETPSPEPD